MSSTFFDLNFSLEIPQRFEVNCYVNNLTTHSHVPAISVGHMTFRRTNKKVAVLFPYIQCTYYDNYNNWVMY